MQLALSQAAEAEQAGEVPVGAVVVKNGVVVGVGRNQTLETGDPTAHAEVLALRAAAKKIGNHRLDGLELFVTLEPCPMCSGAIFHSRLSRLVYGATDPKTGSAGSVTNLFEIPQLNHHTVVVSGTLADQCAQQLQSFFQKLRSTKSKNKFPLREDALRSNEADFSVFHDFLKNGCFWMSSEGWRVHYIDASDVNASKTMLFLHDFPFWSYQSVKILDKLKSFGYRVIAPDLIGCGLSDKPKRSDWHCAPNHAKVVGELINYLEVNSLEVVTLGRSGYLLDFLAAMQNFSIVRVLKIDLQSNVIRNFSELKANKLIWKKNLLPYLKSFDQFPLQAALTPFPDTGYSAVLEGMFHLSFGGHIPENKSADKHDQVYPLELSGQQAEEVLKKIIQ